MTQTDAAIWHDVECACYSADLELWLKLAAEAGGPVLDLGCGTGRVARHLASAGYRVVGLDCDPVLVRTLRARVHARGLDVDAVIGDARSFELGRRFALVIAAMQVVQLLGGADGRADMLACARRHLERGGVFAIALADPFEAVSPTDARPPLPDVLEHGGWVYSSTPIAVYPHGSTTVIERRREAVSPTGELDESIATVHLDSVAAETLYDEAHAVGFAALPARSVPPTDDHVGSTVVVLEAR